MPIHALGDVEPEIHPDASVHPEASVHPDAVQSYLQRGKRFRAGPRPLAR
ncbi:MAG: hypothetical protein ACRDRK_16390 [Pseudonocardia sp.]